MVLGKERECGTVLCERALKMQDAIFKILKEQYFHTFY